MAKKKNNSTPRTNEERREWLKSTSEKLVNSTFKNLEENFKLIEKEYNQVYNEIVTKLVKLTEESIKDGKITSPTLYQNKFAQIVQQAVIQLTQLDDSHGDYLSKLLENYHETISSYQAGILKLAREEGILFREKELNESALSIAVQYPYEKYPFKSALAKGTVKVGEKLNILLANKIIEGTSVVKLIPKIEEAFNLKRYEAERIARTETSRVLNNASLNVYKHAGIQKVKWLDSTEAIKGSKIKKALVCGECRKVATFNDGVYSMEELPQIPLHPHCRCTITPVVEDIPYNIPKKDKPIPEVQEDLKQVPRELKHKLSFKNLAEATKYLEENLGMFSEVKRTAEIQHITSFINISEELRKDFPELKEVVKGLKWDSGSAIAWFGFVYNNRSDYVVGNINLTPKYFKKGGLYGKERKATPTGWHVKSIGEYNSAESTIYHEYGHAIHLLLGSKIALEKYGRVTVDYARNSSLLALSDSKRKVLEKLGIEDDREAYRYFLKNVGKYATTTDEELFAECFADVRMNGEQADEFSKLFIEDVERKLKAYENRSK